MYKIFFNKRWAPLQKILKYHHRDRLRVCDMDQILRNLLFPLDFPCLNLWNPHFELNHGLWIWNCLDENQPNSVNTTEYFIIFFKIENSDFLTRSLQI